MPKLIDTINERVEAGHPFFSLEFFPPRTTAGAVNLFDRFDRMAAGSPLFVDITWGAGGGVPSDDEITSSMSVADTSLNLCGLATMLHFTCSGLTKKQITAILRKAKEKGIRNIMALRGDPVGDEWETVEGGFAYATDLVRHIKKKFGDYFGIAVAGYPAGHPDCKDLDTDIGYLKEKVDAGADFIVTQLFFEPQTFVDFVKKCRDAGITCPIIPGILPIQGYASLRHLVKLSKLRPPQYIIDEIESRKDDDNAIRTYGIDLATKMCQHLLDAGVAPGFHFYTLNREYATKKILENLNMWCTSNPACKTLPWKTSSANDLRAKEEVRPIFWSCRPKSYLLRTKNWDDFPNGRWGDSNSPAYGDLSNYYLFKSSDHDKKKLIELWGEPQNITDICNVFVDFLTPNSPVTRIPWSEARELEEETRSLTSLLTNLNKNGILTTNSQPAVNGVSSTDPIHGWGGPGGYIYKKAYLEFFISKPRLLQLLDILKGYPSISLLAQNSEGHTISNHDDLSITAVTWGVFPNKEIIQPTVVDPESFPIWRDEAFSLWKSEWAVLYPVDSVPRRLIESIYNEYYLVDLVDNDYINGNIFSPFDQLLANESQR